VNSLSQMRILTVENAKHFRTSMDAILVGTIIGIKVERCVGNNESCFCDYAVSVDENKVKEIELELDETVLEGLTKKIAWRVEIGVELGTLSMGESFEI
jgi:hypothetical protein